MCKLVNRVTRDTWAYQIGVLKCRTLFNTRLVFLAGLFSIQNNEKELRTQPPDPLSLFV